MKSTIEVKSIKMNRSGDPDSQATLHKLVSSHCGSHCYSFGCNLYRNDSKFALKINLRLRQTLSCTE